MEAVKQKLASRGFYKEFGPKILAALLVSVVAFGFFSGGQSARADQIFGEPRLIPARPASTYNSVNVGSGGAYEVTAYEYTPDEFPFWDSTFTVTSEAYEEFVAFCADYHLDSAYIGDKYEYSGEASSLGAALAFALASPDYGSELTTAEFNRLLGLSATPVEDYERMLLMHIVVWAYMEGLEGDPPDFWTGDMYALAYELNNPRLHTNTGGSLKAAYETIIDTMGDMLEAYENPVNSNDPLNPQGYAALIDVEYDSDTGTLYVERKGYENPASSNIQVSWTDSDVIFKIGSTVKTSPHTFSATELENQSYNAPFYVYSKSGAPFTLTFSEVNPTLYLEHGSIEGYIFEHRPEEGDDTRQRLLVGYARFVNLENEITVQAPILQTTANITVRKTIDYGDLNTTSHPSLYTYFTIKRVDDAAGTNYIHDPINDTSSFYVYTYSGTSPNVSETNQKTFSALTVGTHYFKISENTGSLSTGWAAVGDTERIIRIEVDADPLTSTVYEGDGTTPLTNNEIGFTNEYTAQPSGYTWLDFYKDIIGKSSTGSNDGFAFRLDRVEWAATAPDSGDSSKAADHTLGVSTTTITGIQPWNSNSSYFGVSGLSPGEVRYYRITETDTTGWGMTAADWDMDSPKYFRVTYPTDVAVWMPSSGGTTGYWSNATYYRNAGNTFTNVYNKETVEIVAFKAIGRDPNTTPESADFGFSLTQKGYSGSNSNNAPDPTSPGTWDAITTPITASGGSDQDGGAIIFTLDDIPVPSSSTSKSSATYYYFLVEEYVSSPLINWERDNNNERYARLLVWHDSSTKIPCYAVEWWNGSSWVENAWHNGNYYETSPSEQTYNKFTNTFKLIDVPLKFYKNITGTSSDSQGFNYWWEQIYRPSTDSGELVEIGTFSPHDPGRTFGSAQYSGRGAKTLWVPKLSGTPTGKEYYYRIDETSSSGDGWTCNVDGVTLYAKVTVTLDTNATSIPAKTVEWWSPDEYGPGDGDWVTELDGTNYYRTFTNDYSAASFTPSIYKNVEGAFNGSISGSQVFEFKLYEVDDAFGANPNPIDTQYEERWSAGESTVYFNEVTGLEVGDTRYYMIKEVIPYGFVNAASGTEDYWYEDSASNPTWRYDGHEIIFKVEVGRDSSGYPEAEITWASSETDNDYVFTNTYLKDDMILTAYKSLHGASSTSKSFDFEMKQVNYNESTKAFSDHDAPYTKTYTTYGVSGTKHITFDISGLNFDSIYYFEVKETTDSGYGWECDKRTFYAKVDTAGSGKSISWWNPAAQDWEPPGTDPHQYYNLFTNNFIRTSASIPIYKKVDGLSGTLTKQFTFYMERVTDRTGATSYDGTKQERTMTGTNYGAAVYFPANNLDVGETYYYKITEKEGLDGEGWTYSAKTAIIRIEIEKNVNASSSPVVKVNWLLEDGSWLESSNPYSSNGSDANVFNNSYKWPVKNGSPPTTSVVVEGKKAVTASSGDTAPTGVEFRFELERLNSDDPDDVNASFTPLHSSVTYTGASEPETFSFMIPKLNVGIHYFKVSETTAGGGGWISDGTARVVKVTVNAPETGRPPTSSVNWISGGANEFTNHYSPTGTQPTALPDAAFKVRKLIYGKPSADEVFKFTVTEVDSGGDVVPDGISFSETTTGTITEGSPQDIVFNLEDLPLNSRRYFKVREVSGNEAGWTYADVEYTFEVEVDGSGNVDITYPGQYSPERPPEFENDYRDPSLPPPDATFKVRKLITGIGGTDEVFTFAVTEVDDQGEEITTGVHFSATTRGHIYAGLHKEVMFELYNLAPSSHRRFRVHEVSGNEAGWIYADVEYTFEVEVDGSGNATVKYPGSYSPSNPPVFENKYEEVNARFRIRKLITGIGETDESFEFSVTEEDEAGNELRGGIRFSKRTIGHIVEGSPQDIVFELENLGRNVKRRFRVNEVSGNVSGWVYSTAEYTIAVEVDGDGNVDVTYPGAYSPENPPEFVNVHDGTSPPPGGNGGRERDRDRERTPRGPNDPDDPGDPDDSGGSGGSDDSDDSDGPSDTDGTETTVEESSSFTPESPLTNQPIIEFNEVPLGFGSDPGNITLAIEKRLSNHDMQVCDGALFAVRIYDTDLNLLAREIMTANSNGYDLQISGLKSGEVYYIAEELNDAFDVKAYEFGDVYAEQNAVAMRVTAPAGNNPSEVRMVIGNETDQLSSDSIPLGGEVDLGAFNMNMVYDVVIQTPQAPKTGDSMTLGIAITAFILSTAVLLEFVRNKKRAARR